MRLRCLEARAIYVKFDYDKVCKKACGEDPSTKVEPNKMRRQIPLILAHAVMHAPYINCKVPHLLI